MIRIGIVGAENSHSIAISKTLNVAKAVPGFRAVAIWGETKAFAEKAAEAGRIPRIVRRPADMIGEIDAVVVDHRHARRHLPAAEPFLTARLPMFIDKPFCYRLAAGRRFLARARRLNVPVTSFSTVPTYPSFETFRRAVGAAGGSAAVASFGPCDLNSEYGGVFFYGIHQVDLLLTLLGADVRAVGVSRAPAGGAAVANLFWKDGRAAAMHCLPSHATGFQLSAATEAGNISAKLVGRGNPYLAGVRRFCRMFKTGREPVGHERILAPVAVLEAMQKSVRTGKLTPVAKV